MESSVRQQLKLAREALGRKDYNAALACCKTVLRDNVPCYEALVFVGKAAFGLNEYKQAEAAYQRATGLDPNNPLAWQGLAELYAETGQWAQATQVFSTLATMAYASPDPGLQGRATGFLWRCGDAAMKAGLPAEAEACWRRLLANIPADHPDHLKLLCHLADAQMELEATELQARVKERLVLLPQGLLEGTSEAAVSEAVEAAWAKEVLESNSSAVTLRQIITAAPPSPVYAHYYSSYLRRLRTAVYAAPPQSMERHSRRAEVLHFALATIRGTSALGVPGGCCSMAPFEAALAMLEVEGNVAGAAAAATSLDAASHHAISAAEHAGARAVAEAAGRGHTADVGIRGAGAELQLSAVEQVAKRLAHSFPWCPSASVHLALCLRRRSGSAARTTALVRPSDQVPGSNRHAPSLAAPNTTNLNVLETRQMTAIKHLPAGARRRRLIKCLHHGLHQGGAAASSAAGWLAIAELLLKEGAPEASLDAAKQGLSYLAARDLLGHEALVQADLLLKLAAGRALAAMGGVPPPGSAGYTDLWVYKALMEGAEARALQQQQQSSAGCADHYQQQARPQNHQGGQLSSIQEGHERGSKASADGGSKASADDGSKASADAGGFKQAIDTAREGRSHAQLLAASEAEAWLGSLLLSGRVSSGLAPFACLAGSPSASDVTHQAKRCVAQLAIARGDIKHARQLYELLVGAAAAGRSGPQMPEHWAAAEYGTLLLMEGEQSAAYRQLNMAIEALGPSPRSVAAAAATPTYSVAMEAQHQCMAARYHLLAAQAAWELGGEHRTTQGAHAHSHLLLSAAAAERSSTAAAIVDDLYTRNCAQNDSVAAFVMLGAWYQQCAGDRARAIKCYHRALTINPTSDTAGEALVSLLRSLGLLEQAMSLCEEAVEAGSAQPGGSTNVQWALKHLAALKLATGDHEGSVATHQRAMRTERNDSQLWEGLGASYQGLGRTSAALKSYTRALSLSPNRLYSLVQSGVLHYQLADYGESAAAFSRALALAPHYPPALLGAAETALASAFRHASMGANGMASMQLDAAVHHAQLCTTVHSGLQAGWKQLGDAQLQHATITPHAHLHACPFPSSTHAAAAPLTPGTPALTPGTAENGSLGVSAENVLASLRARLERVQAAGHAYSQALQLNPSQGLVWGDLAMSLHQQALLHHMLALHSSSHSDQPHHNQQQQELRSKAFNTVLNGLKLQPTSDWLWAIAGAFAAADAIAMARAPGQQWLSPECQLALGQAELCMSRSLQLNPKRATTWAALGRLYAAQDRGDMAQWCFDQCRSFEPTLVPVWEGMAYLAGRRSKAWGDAAYLDMMDAYEHAVGLGGSAESRLAFSTAAVLAGRGSEGEVRMACSKAAAEQPTLVAAYNTLGLAEESRAHYAEAAEAYAVALNLLQHQQQHQQLWVTSCLQPGQVHGLENGAHNGGAFDGDRAAEWKCVHLAVQMNHARALACAGMSAEAVEAYERLQATEGGPAAMGAEPSALLAHAHALHAVDRAQDALSVLESALAAALAAEVAVQEAPASVPTTSPAVAKAQRFGIALALCRAYCARGRVRDALTLVSCRTSAGTEAAAEGPVASISGVGVGGLSLAEQSIELQMWMTVLVGAAIEARSKGVADQQQQQDVKEADAKAAMLSWSMESPGVDQAQVRAALGMLSADLAAADGQATRSLRAAAAAVHACPCSSAARARLASAASSASPTYASATLRNADQAPAVPCSRRTLLPAATATGNVQLHQQHLVPTSIGGLLAHVQLAPSARLPGSNTQPQAPQGLAQEEIVPPHLTHPQAAHHPSALRASSLLVQVSEDASELGLCHALDAEARHLSKLVHAHPSGTGYWYLLALVSLHQAGSSGGRCQLYRRALARCKVALSLSQAEFRHAAKAAAEEEAEARAAPAQTVAPKAPLVMPPALQMLSQAGAHSTFAVLGPKALARNRVAYCVLRLLTALSESHLQSRLLGGHTRAKDAATDALRWALQHCQSHVALAHHQLGRCHVLEGHTPNAEVSLSQAARGGDIPSILEYARLLAQSAGTEFDRRHHRHPQQERAAAGGTGGEGTVADWLQGALQAKALSAQPGEQALHACAQLAEVPLHLQQQQEGGIQAAYTMAKKLVEAKLPLRAQPAAHILLAYTCLTAIASQPVVGDQAQEAPESLQHQRKKLGLEARWAARTALKLLDSLDSSSTRRTILLPVDPHAPLSIPSKASKSQEAVAPQKTTRRGGTRHVFGLVVTRAAAVATAAAAEMVNNKKERAVEATGQALQLGADLVPLLVASIATASDSVQQKGAFLPQRLATKIVHAQPWLKEAWAQLV